MSFVSKYRSNLVPALVVALALFIAPLQARPSTVFVGNQQVVRDSATGAVSVIHFFRLLEEREREKLRLEGSSLLLTDQEGTQHRLALDDQRKLVEWERALMLLGYSSRVNKDTGVVDYHLNALGSGQVTEVPDQESEEVRRERSLRRPGYRRAQAKYQKVLGQIGLSTDQEARRRVDRLGQQVAAVSPLSGILWNFDVINTRVPNALCTGEGHVLVTVGLLELELTDDELAGVLGHEVAHGVRRHADLYEERFLEFLGIRELQLEYSYERQKDADLQDPSKLRQLRSKLEDKQKRYQYLLNYLQNRRDYNQDEEEEADVLGMQYALAAGFDPEGESRALIKLKARSVQLFGQGYGDGSRTHPPLERRLQILKTVRDRWRQ